jgi:hypothetical protein
MERQAGQTSASAEVSPSPSEEMQSKHNYTDYEQKVNERAGHRYAIYTTAQRTIRIAAIVNNMMHGAFLANR